MRAIARSISVLVLGCSSLAIGSTAQADRGVTLVYSTGSYGAYPHAISNRYYSPRKLHRDRVCALPYRGHSYSHRYDDRKHGHSQREPVRWIDRQGYHHRDDQAYQHKHQHRHADRSDDRSYSRSAHNSRDSRY